MCHPGAAFGGEAADEWQGRHGNEPSGKQVGLVPAPTLPFAGARFARADRRPFVCD
jgi:hypothetical protein